MLPVRRTTLLVLLSALSFVSATTAATPKARHDPIRGTLTVPSEGVAGVPVNCTDVRTGAPFDYYAQHLLGDGAIDTTWNPATAHLCVGGSEGLRQVVRADGAGGVFVVWVSTAREDGDIRIQHFTSSGEIATGWPAEGAIACQARYSQYDPDVVADGAGGGYVVWTDTRSGERAQVYIHRLTSTALSSPGWADNGHPVHVQAAEQSSPRIAADGQGGAFVIWRDARGGIARLYVQRIASSGSPVDGWPIEGVQLTQGGNVENSPSVIGDSTGATTVVWQDEGDGTTTSLRTILIPGTALPSNGWPGTPLTLASGSFRLGPCTLVAGPGGTRYVAWVERTGSAAVVRATRLSADGHLAPGWPYGGLSLSEVSSGRWAPGLACLPDSSVALAWDDQRFGDQNIFAQRLQPDDGTSMWAATGVAVCTARGDQYAPSLAAGSDGSVTVTWADAALGLQAAFAAARPVNGGKLAALSTSSVLPGHVRLTWRVAPQVGTTLRAYRQVNPQDGWLLLNTVTADDSGRVVLDDRSAPEGTAVSYRLAIAGEGYEQLLEPVSVQVPRAPDHLALARIWARPSENAIAIVLALPRGALPTFELFDVMGRRLQRDVLGQLEPGEQEVHVGISSRLPSGVYFVRVSQGAEKRSGKVVFIR